MYELDKASRQETVEELVKLLPAEKHEKARKETNSLADLFEGQDMNALGVLYRAAEVGKFDEYALKLKKYYEKEGKNISVTERSVARNQNIPILRIMLQKETQIANGERDKKDRSYWPNAVQNLAKHTDSIKMELFFADCFEEIMVKK